MALNSRYTYISIVQLIFSIMITVLKIKIFFCLCPGGLTLHKCSQYIMCLFTDAPHKFLWFFLLNSVDVNKPYGNMFIATMGVWPLSFINDFNFQILLFKYFKFINGWHFSALIFNKYSINPLNMSLNWINIKQEFKLSFVRVYFFYFVEINVFATDPITLLI